MLAFGNPYQSIWRWLLVLGVFVLARQGWTFLTLSGLRNDLFELVFRSGSSLLAGLICWLVARASIGPLRRAWFWIAASILWFSTGCSRTA